MNRDSWGVFHRSSDTADTAAPRLGSQSVKENRRQEEQGKRSVRGAFCSAGGLGMSVGSCLPRSVRPLLSGQQNVAVCPLRVSSALAFKHVQKRTRFLPASVAWSVAEQYSFFLNF